MKITFSIYIPIYGQDVIFFSGMTGEEVYKHWKNKVFKGYVSDLQELIPVINRSTGDGNFFFHDDSNLMLLTVKPTKDKLKFQSTLVHEVCHLVFKLLHRRGLPLHIECDEAYTYLIAYVYKEIMKQYNATKAN